MSGSGERYCRHIEVEERPKPGRARRWFEYNCLSHLRTDLPVLTTAIYLFPSRLDEEAAYRVQFRGQDLIYFRYNLVKLWEIDANSVLGSGAPGLLALVPLMAGGNDLPTIKRACQAIGRAGTENQVLNAQVVLLALAGAHYNYKTLSRLIGRDKMIRSSVIEHFIEEGRTEGEAKGRVEGESHGRLEAERELCLEMVREFRPSLLAAARPVILACSNADTLKRWCVLAPRSRDDGGFARARGLGG